MKTNAIEKVSIFNIWAVLKCPMRCSLILPAFRCNDMELNCIETCKWTLLYFSSVGASALKDNNVAMLTSQYCMLVKLIWTIQGIIPNCIFNTGDYIGHHSYQSSSNIPLFQSQLFTFPTVIFPPHWLIFAENPSIDFLYRLETKFY